jgi:class 3 adenylate cyclase/DNA-binding beta-propeller fold protein YncE
MLRRSQTRRVLVTVLFTDIVASTERAEALGDRAWKELLARHHRVVRRHLRRHRGREVDTAGDGFFITFEQPAEAIACALEVADAIDELGIQIRGGLHFGEVEPAGKKVAGIAVHVGARILASAAPGQIVVSATVRDLVSGSGHRFVDLGLRQLKGVEGDWRLFAVERPAPVAPAAGASPPLRGTRRTVPALIAAGLVLLGAISTVTVILLTAAGGKALTGGNVVRAVAWDGSLGAGFRVGRGPSSVLVAGGDLWVANTDAGTVSRIEPADGDSSDVGAGVPVALASAGEQIWVLDPFAATLSVVDPEGARVVDTVEVHGRAIAAAGDVVWVADDVNDAVHRVDARSRSVRASIQLPAGSGPSAIAADEDDVWVVNGLSGTVSHIDARSGSMLAAAIALTGKPTAVAIGDGAVWVTSSEGDLLFEIDPSTNRVRRAIEAVCDVPTAVAAGQGAVWVACLGDRTLRRIDPAGGEAVTVRLEGVPGGIAVDGDKVWATVRDS